MGLLDDAIREHLELRRLRGADPGEVARQEREALSPVDRSGVEYDDEPDDGVDEQEDEPEDDGRHHDLEAEGSAGRVRAAGSGPADAGGDTAELDMEMILNDDPVAPVRADRSTEHEDLFGSSLMADEDLDFE